MDPALLIALAGGLLVVGGVAVLAMWMTARGRRRQSAGGGPGAPAPTVAPLTGARLGAEAWVAASPSLEALGLAKLDAETYWLEHDLATQSLYLSLHVRDGTVSGRLERPCPGGMLECFLGTTAKVRPGHPGDTELTRFVAGETREVLGALPHASLDIKTPELPGGSYSAIVTTPFSAPDQPALVARTLLTLDAAARRPAPAGSQVRLPPVAMAWQEAGPSLEALGLTKLSAGTYWREHDLATQSLYLSVDVRDASLTGRLERPCPGGALEGFLCQEAELRPGAPARSELAQFVSGCVGEVLGMLPQEARLAVKTPEIPGDSYRAILTTPFTTPGQASVVARALSMLDEAVRRR